MQLKKNKNLSYTLYRFSSFSFDILFLLDKYAEFTKAMSPLCLE